LHGIAHPAFGTDRGCAAADTVWRGVVRARSAKDRGHHAAEALADITKCFEKVPYTRLIARATALGFPTQLLRLSIRSYRWERRITDGVAYAPAAFTRLRAVIAGSSFAVAELRALVHMEVVAVCQALPRAIVTVFVDDGAAATTRKATARLLGQGYDAVKAAFQEACGLPLDPGKLAVAATSRPM
jgi:hypothetical protein